MDSSKTLQLGGTTPIYSPSTDIYKQNQFSLFAALVFISQAQTEDWNSRCMFVLETVLILATPSCYIF